MTRAHRTFSGYGTTAEALLRGLLARTDLSRGVLADVEAALAEVVAMRERLKVVAIVKQRAISALEADSDWSSERLLTAIGDAITILRPDESGRTAGDDDGVTLMRCPKCGRIDFGLVGRVCSHGILRQRAGYAKMEEVRYVPVSSGSAYERS